MSRFEDQVKMLNQRLTRLLDSHVSPWRQTGQQTRRLASARRAPPLKFKRCVGIAVLLYKRFQDGPKTSISFGVKAENPDFPCREDVLVEDGAKSPESCLHPWRCAHQ